MRPENYGNHENPRISLENNENNENYRITQENHKKIKKCYTSNIESGKL